MSRSFKVLLSGALLVIAVSLLYGTEAGGAEKRAAGSVAARVTRMRAAGMVTEISDTALTMERKIKGRAESMEFVLEKPAERIGRGDKVRVTYIIKDDRNVATKVTKYIPQTKAKKQKKPTGATAAPPAR